MDVVLARVFESKLKGTEFANPMSTAYPVDILSQDNSTLPAPQMTCNYLAITVKSLDLVSHDATPHTGLINQTLDTFLFDTG